MTETPIYKYGGITISNIRARFGSKSYVVRDISSVDMETIEPNMLWPLLLIGGGLIAAGFGAAVLLSYLVMPEETMLAVLLLSVAATIWGIFLGGYLWMNTPTMYGLTFVESGRDVIAYLSKEKYEIVLIEDVLNRAIARANGL